ncbi:DMT family transporter [Pyxidicoccus sp. 3LFB2]
MALAIGSPSPSHRARPRLWMVFAAVGVAGFVLTLAGLSFVRVYDNQLIRQTESELIAQGAVLAGVYRERLRDAVGVQDYGRERTARWPFPIPDDKRLKPILPSLKASDASLPPDETPAPSRVPAEPHAREVGARMGPLLEHVRTTTLAGIRVLDTEGVVVGSSSAELLGTSLADRAEVQRALRGEPASVLRRRYAEPEDTPLASLSRDTGIRVSVAIPVLEGERVWGVVVLARTPMTFAKATYADRWNLTATGLVLVAAVALMGAHLFADTPLTGFTPRTWAVLAGLALVPQLIGHSLLNASVRYLSTPFVAVSTLGEPVLATLWAVPLLGEKPDWVQLIGGGMALVGVVLMAREESLRKPPPPDMVPAAD